MVFTGATLSAVLCSPAPCSEVGHRIAVYFNYLFLAVFTLEAMLKITALGLCGERTSYLGNPWHWLDLLAVIAMWFEMSAGDDVQVCSDCMSVRSRPI